jgi:hypothetical protein
VGPVKPLRSKRLQHRRVLRFIGVAVVLSVALCAFAQCGSADTLRCEEACETANTCGLLPSPIGATTYGISAKDNCIARCKLTNGGIGNTITSCLGTVGDAGFVRQWCEPLAACARAANCLRTAAGGPGLLGNAGLSIVVLDSDAGDSTSPPTSTSRPTATDCKEVRERACTSSECAPEETKPCDRAVCTNSITETRADEWCKAVGSSTARPAVEQFGAWHPGEELSCAQALARPSLIEGITPGMFYGLVEVRGVLVADAGAGKDPSSTRYCVNLFGARTAISAGSIDRTAVQLPSTEAFLQVAAKGIACESDPLACSDGVDNDNDDAVDCADPSCAAFCPTVARPPCDGGACDDGGDAAVQDAATPQDAADGG